MTTEDEYLKVQYFYNSINEFIYFIIIYIENDGFVCLSRISKHVKFFKTEVADLISSFPGNILEEKLCSMLKVIHYFIISEDKIKVNDNLNLKDIILRDLVLSKTVDLVLRGICNIRDICKNLNVNNTISISQETLLNLLKKSVHFSVEDDCLVSVLHVHGILGFDDYMCSLIVNYFQDILQHDRKLSYGEIKDHCKFLSPCGVYNLLAVFCILYCSNQFHCKNGQIWLRKKAKKYPKQKPLDIESLNFLIGAAEIGQIVHSMCGCYIQKWIGEIGRLSESSGSIYCVVDFTNGHQGVFSIYFNKSALKVISEICNLKLCLKVRDVVEFDAEFCDSRKVDNKWKATRVKVLSSDKFNYDESLFNKVKHNSDLQRKKCFDGKCCLNSIESSRMNVYGHASYDCVKSSNFSMQESEKKQIPTIEISNYDLNSKSSSVNETYDETKSDKNKDCQESSTDVCTSISNFILLNYSFMFGYVFMLMENKGILIAKQGNKIYNILFMKDSIYLPNKSQKNFAKGQKVLAFIPYLEEVESFSVATLVYGLSNNEANETEVNLVNPQNFIIEYFLPKVSKDLNHNFSSSCCNILNSLLFQTGGLINRSQQTAKFDELHTFLTSHCEVLFCDVNLLQFLNGLLVEKLGDNFNNRISHFVVKLAKCLVTYNVKRKKPKGHNVPVNVERTRSPEKMDNSSTTSTENIIEFREFSASLPEVKAIKENDIKIANFAVRSRSPDFSSGSWSSLNSFKSCCSTNSEDTFYSCYGSKHSSKCSNSLPDKLDSLLDIEVEQKKSLHLERNISDYNLGTPVATTFHSNLNSVDSTSSETLKPHLELETANRTLKSKYQKDQQTKYFKFKSYPVFKHTFHRKRKRIFVSNVFKSGCENCYKSSLKSTACISLISETFFFYSLNISGCDVVLPLPKKVVPENLQEKMKLNSCNEIVVIPNTVLNFSHILAVNMKKKTVV